MPFTLPILAYKENALEPYISKKTIDFHYGKHLQGYINNLNNLIKGTKFEKANLEDIVNNSDGATFNNGAQAWNHIFYFKQFSPTAKKQPEGKLNNAIIKEFESFDNFIEKFSQTANTLFGAGWVWLVKKYDNSLAIIPESNAGNPMLIGLKPIMVIDVWEHAYYLDYQNRRPEYVKNFWHILDWNIISKRYEDEQINL
ncbi:superoxide dismutase [Bacteroidota bacterium]